MLGTIRYAEQIYYDKKREWNKMVDRAMAADFSWEVSAKKYQEMYELADAGDPVAMAKKEEYLRKRRDAANAAYRAKKAESDEVLLKAE